MTKKPDRFDSVVAEAPPTGETASVAAPKAAKLELGGDELIQFSIKPSLWFIPLVAAKWLVAICVLGAVLILAMRAGSVPETIVPFQILAAVAALCIGFATLQWATRLYVLTNRRVMRFRGVLNVDVAECPLNRISGVELHVAPQQRVLRLGTIEMKPLASNVDVIVWEQLAHPAEIHERLVRAIRKSQSRR